LLYELDLKGFHDLRASFLEILIIISKEEGPTLKYIGEKCHLKKQTMTSHINELVKRGYVKKVKGEKDGREQRVYFTQLGERLKLTLLEAIQDIESSYKREIGELEFMRVNEVLSNFYKKINLIDKNKIQNL
jgi:DNA-binding MarR family transcriptional regulator